MWETYDHICADRTTPDLAWMAEHLAYHGEMDATPELLTKLEEISISTVKRILNRIGRYEPRLRRRKPKESPLTKRIPVRRIPYYEKEPGHREAGCSVCSVILHGGQGGQVECRPWRPLPPDCRFPLTVGRFSFRIGLTLADGRERPRCSYTSPSSSAAISRVFDWGAGGAPRPTDRDDAVG